MVFRRDPRPSLAFLALLALLASAAWYKHVASPRYHTVGRASGLLMGARRSPYLWRRHLDGAARGGGGRPQQPRDSSPPRGGTPEGPPAGEQQPPRFGDPPRRGQTRDPLASAARSRNNSPSGWAASMIPRPARRDPWAALGPLRRRRPKAAAATPWRSPVLQGLERAMRKTSPPQLWQEAADSPLALEV